MNRPLNIGLLLLSFSVASHPASIDRVIFSHAGYKITANRSGELRIDFVLNQKGLKRSEIESTFAGYPKEKVRAYTVGKKEVENLFRLLESDAFKKLNAEYLASPGTFAYHGHRVIMSVTVESAGKEILKVMFDSSRRKDWPDSLRKTTEQIISLAEKGGPLPRGPFID